MKVLHSFVCGLVSLGFVSATGIAGPLPVAPKAGQLLLAKNSVKPTNPAPGIYEVAPCTGVVLVPAEMDSRCIIRNKGGNISMPMAKPDFRLIPREEKH